MIGRVPETLADRAIVVNLTRKLTTDKVQPLAGYDPVEIRRMCLRWAQDNRENVRNEPRNDIEGISDRASDTFDTLIAIAGMASQEWETKLHQAALHLYSYANTEPEGASLLLDLMSVFMQRPSKRVFSRELPRILKSSTGWAVYDASSRENLTELGIARVLRRYGIKPITVRIDDEVGKGYKWEQFERAMMHYVSKPEMRAKLEDLRQMTELALQAKEEKEAKQKLQQEKQQLQDEQDQKAKEEAFGRREAKLAQEEAKVILQLAKLMAKEQKDKQPARSRPPQEQNQPETAQETVTKVTM
jgi:hypothetical protein